jgi:hypothetical protein
LFFITLFLLTVNPIAISFIELSDLKNQEDYIEKIDNREVSIRGFLYELPGGSFVLAKEPNLKTCCLGKGKLQIHIDNPGNSLPKPSMFPVTLEGRFNKQTVDGKPEFHLELFL